MYSNKSFVIPYYELMLKGINLIYTWLIVYTILNLAYPKEHIV